MDRRGLFKRLGAAAAAVAVGAGAAPPAVSETDAIRALVEDVLAHPGKHPEIEAQAPRLRGEERIHEAAPTTRHWTYTPPTFMPTAMTATSASFGLYSSGNGEELAAAVDEMAAKPGGEMLTMDDFRKARAMLNQWNDPA